MIVVPAEEEEVEEEKEKKKRKGNGENCNCREESMANNYLNRKEKEKYWFLRVL
jgi:hypothetical protein